MSEVIHNAEREFWQPPVAASPMAIETVVQPAMVEACDNCETEFIPGSRFCHACGAERAERSTKNEFATWMQHGVCLGAPPGISQHRALDREHAGVAGPSYGGAGVVGNRIILRSGCHSRGSDFHGADDAGLAGCAGLAD